MDGSNPIFSRQQVMALDAVARWLQQESSSQQIFRLFGYAGTGKTTIAKHLAASLDGNVVYGAYTGKAALVMQQNGCTGAATLHSLIYKPLQLGNGQVQYVLNPASVITSADLIVIDECSMVNSELAHDLMSFGKPILVLGDPAQLPPADGVGFFTKVAPNVMLTEIHRQASESPIIHLATTVRENGRLDLGNFGGSRVIELKNLLPHDLLNCDQILVGKNDTRHGVNAGVRDELGRSGALPDLNDRLVCTKNDARLGIFNGETFSVVEKPTFNASERSIRMKLQGAGPEYLNIEVNALKECFSGDMSCLNFQERRRFQEFDYGYALTVHKAQGSQWPNVVVWNESDVFRPNSSRWLYSAITRASENVTITI